MVFSLIVALVPFLTIFQLNCVILVLRYKGRFTAAATRPAHKIHSLSL